MLNYLNLPALPNYLEKQIRLLVSESIERGIESLNINASDTVLEEIKKFKYNINDSLGYPLVEATGDIAKFDFLDVNNEITEWVRDNIGEFAYISIQHMHSGRNIPPHIDEIRYKAYNYIISTGNATTSFYKPKKEFQHLHVYPHTTFTDDRIELVDRITIEAHRWHEINTSMIHGVDNLDYPRISLSLSIVDIK